MLIEEVRGNHPTIVKWNNVNNGEFPKNKQSVLVYCETTGGIIKSVYREYMKDGKRVYFSFGSVKRKWWMPLPEPPKEEP